MCSRSRSLPLFDPDEWRDLLGECRLALRRLSALSSFPPAAERAASLNSCRLTLALRPPPPVMALAVTPELDWCGSGCGLGIELSVLSRVERDDETEGRSKMELAAEDGPIDDVGEPSLAR